MKKILPLLATALILVISASAEIKSIDITIFGMDWEVCAHAVRVSLKAVVGVDSVEVNLEKGLASVKLKPGNTVSFKQLNEAISKNGFTMKDSVATVAGTVAEANGKTLLRVSGSNDVLTLTPDGPAQNAPTETGKSVVVTGVVLEATKGKLPDVIRYRSMIEE